MSLFSEDLIIMNRQVQQGPAGPVVTWSEGAKISAKFQISNMMNVQIAMAQGVKASGYIAINQMQKHLLETNMILKHLKSNQYVKVLDNGILESGTGTLKDVQFAVEVIPSLPL